MNPRKLIAFVFAAFLTILSTSAALADDESASNQSDSSTQTNSNKTKPLMYDPKTDRYIYRDGTSRQRMWYDKEEPEFGPSPYTYRTVTIPQYRVVKKTKRVAPPRMDRTIDWIPFIIFGIFLVILVVSNLYGSESRKKKKSKPASNSPIFTPPVSIPSDTNSSNSNSFNFTSPETKTSESNSFNYTHPETNTADSDTSTPPVSTPAQEQLDFSPNTGDNQNENSVNHDNAKPVETVESIKRDALQGDMRAQRILGEYYENGFGNISPDVFNAVKWTWKAANQGDAEAQCRLGKYYEMGTGVKKNPEKAVEWYQKAVNQGSVNAQIALGWYCYSNGEPEAAVEWWDAAAMTGNPNAQCILAKCYENGDGVEKDPAKAVELYQKAVEQDYTEAQTNMGFCFMNGVGVEKDPAQAVEWWIKAAEKGDPSAQTTLALCYKDGIGVKKDLNIAKGWLQLATDKGYPKAMYELGMIYLNHSSNPFETYNGKNLLLRAAELGNEDAIAFLHGLEAMIPLKARDILDLLSK